MHQIASRLRSVIKFFREHVLELNKEGVVPKLSYNVQLSSKCVELAMKEVSELNEFIKFHEKLAASNEAGNGKCQCSRVSAARVNLTNHKVKIKKSFLHLQL